MSRNLVLCCDGTSNQFTAHRTNVLKLCYALEKDGERQLVYYHPGIGTRAPVGIGTSFGTFWGKIAGLAFGHGLRADIADAYIFLMNHYRPGDRVFIFGFSRGAYTARVIAGMLKLYGLSMPGNDALVPYAVDMMWAISKIRDKDKADAYFRLAEEYKATLGAGPCKPHFLGVWDTVNSVGWIGSPLALPYTRNNPDIAITRHAIAIDERRAFFRVNWFQEVGDANLKQVWFPGSHCDVGGGYPEAESGLSKYALEWMAGEAARAGLLLDPVRLEEVLGRRGGAFVPPSPRQPHNSITGIWNLAEFVPKARYNRDKGRTEQRMNLFRRRTMPDDACVHDVAWAIPGYSDRLPARSTPLSKKRWDFEPAQGSAAVPPPAAG
jgi:uncharacterized protein (DUF2235 family)